ncbi:MAG: hypothetical protein DRI69_09060 [Bacteroidetes bacterium]|nr:MAG: hypothetical protein DRI69_09060 [Bacteroidota bacterium]
MANKLYDVVAKTGSYQKDGETKNRYLNIGSIMEGEHGPYMIMERTFNPAGLPNPEDRSSLILSLFKPKEKDGASRSAGDAFGSAVMDSRGDDSIPF